jgi:hypothetical protein
VLEALIIQICNLNQKKKKKKAKKHSKEQFDIELVIQLFKLVTEI